MRICIGFLESTLFNFQEELQLVYNILNVQNGKLFCTILFLTYILQNFEFKLTNIKLLCNL